MSFKVNLNSVFQKVYSRKGSVDAEHHVDTRGQRVHYMYVTHKRLLIILQAQLLYYCVRHLFYASLFRYNKMILQLVCIVTHVI